MAWPTAIRIFSGALALLSAAQVAYLAITFFLSSPSPSAELMSEHNGSVYGFLALHSIALVVLGLGSLLSGNTWHRISERLRPHSTNASDPRILCGIVYVGLALAILIIFAVPVGVTRYEVFVDLSAENIIKRDIHLLHTSVEQQTIPFGEIEAITGEFAIHGEDYSTYYYTYKLYVVTREGDRFVLGQDFPRQSSFAEPPHEASSLAQAIADKCGAKVHLK